MFTFRQEREALAPAVGTAPVWESEASGRMIPGDMGITKREYFAAAALSGLCGPRSCGNIDRVNEIADLAVQLADALIMHLFPGKPSTASSPGTGETKSDV